MSGNKSLLLDSLLAQQFVLLGLDLGIDLGTFGRLIAVVARLYGFGWLVSRLEEEEKEKAGMEMILRHGESI